MKKEQGYLVHGHKIELAMKKLYYITLSIALVAMVACGKESLSTLKEDNQIASQEDVILDYPTISVKAEETTKATLNGSLRVEWQTGDKIGVRVYKGTTYDGTDSGSSYPAQDIDWNLSKGEGTTNAAFTSSVALDQYHHWSYAAFYPANDGKGLDSETGGNNISNDTKRVYFHYQASYDNYVFGSTLMPMVANLNTDGLDKRPENISFKHVGGAVIITLNNVPAAANKISLTANQTITGWGSVNPANAGTASIASGDLGNPKGSTVTLSFAAGTDTRNGLVFNFPVPTLTAPTITIRLYHDNTLLWEKTTPNAQPDVPRKGCLQMPALSVPDMDYYTLYILDDTGWDGTDRALYIWNGSDDNKDMGEWPGQKSIGTETISGNKYYKFILPVSKSGSKYRMIFNNNNNGKQAGNLYLNTLSSTKSLYFRVSEKGAVMITNTASPESINLRSVKLYFKGSETPTPTHLHAWGDGDIKTTEAWPGASMTKETINSVDYYYKAFTSKTADFTEQSFTMVLSNNAANQTGDISVTLNSFLWNGEYFFSGFSSGNTSITYDQDPPRWL